MCRGWVAESLNSCALLTWERGVCTLQSRCSLSRSDDGCGEFDTYRGDCCCKWHTISSGDLPLWSTVYLPPMVFSLFAAERRKTIFLQIEVMKRGQKLASHGWEMRWLVTMQEIFVSSWATSISTCRDLAVARAKISWSLSTWRLECSFPQCFFLPCTTEGW
jgi:hypothetical protein